MNSEKKFEFIRSIVAVLIALIVAFIIILAISDDPINTIITFVAGPVSNGRYIGNVIEMSIPLIFTGLATAVVFQASLFNLGAEGIFYFSGAIAAYIAIFFKMPPFVHSFVAIIAAALVGCLSALIPAILKAKWNASELVTSLMFNNILFGVGLYLLNYVLRDTKATSVVSLPFKKSATLPVIVPGTRIHAGLIVALLAVILVYILMYKTKWGYSLRMTGLNRKFAAYSGISTFGVIILAHVLSGTIAGMGGAIETLGMYDKFQWSALPGYGLDGALVAMLGRNNPFGVVGAAVFLAYIRICADLVAMNSNVPSEMVSILQAIIILLVSAERFLHRYRSRMLLKEAR